MKFSKPTKFNKKGMTNQLMLIILVVIAGILIILVVTKFGKTATLDGEINSCRFSVMAQSATSVKPSTSGLTSPLSVNCKKRYVNLYNNHVEIGVNPEDTQTIPVTYNNKQQKQFLELNDFIVNQVVAEELRVCWYEFGNGQVKVFSSDNDKSALYNSNVCFICSEIHFKDGVTNNGFSGINDYLTQTYIQNDRMTYSQYLNLPSLSAENFDTYNTDAKAAGKTNIFDMKFYKDKTYYVLFKKGDWTARANYRFFPMIISADEIGGEDAYGHALCDQEAT